jgi:hypothetical protein
MWQDGQDPKADDIPDFERRAESRLSAAFLQRQASKSSNCKAGTAENYRGSRSDPKNCGNKVARNQ